MSNEKLKERIIHLKEWLRGMKNHKHPDNCPNAALYLEGLKAEKQQDIDFLTELLAVREAQPVASTTKSNIDAVLGGVSTVIWPVRCFKGKTHVDLYTAPPAPPVPIVPDAITADNAPAIFEIAAQVERIGLSGAYGAYASGWNACRTAMLAAAPTPTKAVNDAPKK